ncbi:NnrU family protein [Devosia algicola]|uniref:NnrU family protein n=1 Tax=Devosia algicola TaxID=3026418 RepID=A0ABY7YIW6_9HYPH|nr:NnrU family protein [Devosia algicola]WDR01253.1 NnrU family protein [Devosia algicola]
MLVLLLGLFLFFAIHSVRMVVPAFRADQLASNPRRWKGIYALVSAVGLGLVVWGWWLFRPVADQLYEPPSWGRHLAMLLVWVAFIMIVASDIHMPAGRIKHWVKHPMLVGVGLWSAGSFAGQW